MIEIRNLSKHFGAIRAVDDVTFTVNKGEVLGFLGPNGAGKSTTMKMLAGFLTPTRGTAEICGHDVRSDSMAVKSKIGYLPEGAPLYPDMTVASLLDFVAQARGLDKQTRKARIEDVIARVHLESVRKQRIETLSKGYKRRVGLALAILHDPEVLIMDEPTDGLDPNQKHEVRNLIRRMAEGKVIVLSTHILEEVESVCTRAIIISDGKLCFDGPPGELRMRSRYYNAIELHLKTDTAPGARAELANAPGVAGIEEADAPEGYDGYVVFPVDKRSILREVSDFVYSKGWEVEHMHVDPGRLDDVFRDITQGAPTSVPTHQPAAAAVHQEVS